MTDAYFIDELAIGMGQRMMCIRKARGDEEEEDDFHRHFLYALKTILIEDLHMREHDALGIAISIKKTMKNKPLNTLEEVILATREALVIASKIKKKNFNCSGKTFHDSPCHNLGTILEGNNWYCYFHDYQGLDDFTITNL